MKQNKITLLIIATFLVVGLLSCSKEQLDINDNPNAATDSTMEFKYILPSAQNNTARIVLRSWSWLQNYLGYWARSGTYAPNIQEETYDITTSFQTGIWSSIYDNLMDYQLMQISARRSNAGFYDGIARVMKAHNFAILVDIYNNVPYSQALNGTVYPTPKYDNAVDIYVDLVKQLDTAQALISAADLSESGPNGSLSTYDVMYGDDDLSVTQSNWLKFSNTLKLRILTKFMNGGLEYNSSGSVGSPQTIAPGINLAAEFNKIDSTNYGFITEDAAVQPGYGPDRGSPFYNSYIADNNGVPTTNSIYYKANAFSIGKDANNPGIYEYLSDIRSLLMYEAPASGIDKGVEYGALPTTDNAASKLTGIGYGFAATDESPAILFTAAESYFLQAECMNRGFLTGDAQSTMESGIVASYVTTGQLFIELAGFTAGDFEGFAYDYIASNSGGFDANGDPLPDNPAVHYTATELDADGAVGGLFTIMSQKWLALNGFAPFEVWSDYRRIDFSSSRGIKHFQYGGKSIDWAGIGFPEGPAISKSPSNTKNEIPLRLLYPQSEYQFNAQNVGAQASAGSYPFARIFWDAN